MRPFAALLLLASLAAAQDPAEVLKKAAARYDSLVSTTYDFEQIEVRETGSLRTQQRQRFAGAPGKSLQQALPAGVSYVFDGQFRWAYNPERNQYTKTPASSTIRPAALLHGMQIGGGGARSIGHETLDFPIPVACMVIETPGRTFGQLRYSPVTYWIDPARHLVLKFAYTISDTSRPNAADTSVVVSYPKAAVGQPIDETLFRFTPPRFSAEVERLTFGTMSPLAGKPAPAFELKAEDGSAITLATLKGSVAILRFGSPEDPFLEMAWRALRQKGLLVYSVPPPRYRPVPTERVLYTIPVATDPDGSALKNFGFTYGGTVVIDRQGKILYGAFSANLDELARALQTAGVW